MMNVSYWTGLLYEGRVAEYGKEPKEPILLAKFGSFCFSDHDPNFGAVFGLKKKKLGQPTNMSSLLGQLQYVKIS